MERMWVPFRLLSCLVQDNEFDLSLQHIELVIGGCKPNYKCGALSCRCLKQVCISVSMPGSEELNISGYWPHAEEKGTLPTLHDVLEGV